MRILHTSDWHLGKRLFKLDRTIEHELFLDWLVKVLVEKKIDILLIAGDIFDTPTPPHHSLELFYNFLHRVSKETVADTLIIAGNHDSGQLLSAPSKILASHRVKVWGKLSSDPKEHWITIKKGNVSLDICAIPFFRSFELLPQGEGDPLKALKNYLNFSTSPSKLLMLHHLAGMFEAAGSEQVISLSGVDSIPTELLHHFNYVALGHIHKPQKVGENVYYSGSPLPMRFSETLGKSIRLLEVEENNITSSSLSIPKFRDLFVIKTNPSKYAEDIANIQTLSELKAVAEVQMELKGPEKGLVDKVKELLEAKGIELLSYSPIYQKEITSAEAPEKIFELSPLELFEKFYFTKYPESKDIPQELKEDFKLLLDKVNHASHPS